MKFKASKPINAGRRWDSDYPGFDTKGAQRSFWGGAVCFILQMESSYKKNSEAQRKFTGYTLMTVFFMYV